MSTRYTYATCSTRERAEKILEDGFATGEIIPGERPEIERHLYERADGIHAIRWRITLIGDDRFKD